MFQQLRKILHLDTLEDQIVQFNHNIEEIHLLKCELDDLVEEYNINSNEYIKQRNYFKEQIEKGVTDGGVLLDRVETKFNRYFNEYLCKIADIKKSIVKLNKDQDRLSSDERFYNIYKQLEQEKANDIIVKAYRLGKVTRDVFEKALRTSGKIRYSDCIVKNSNGEVLFLKRSKESDFYPNTLSLPGGHVDRGETFEQAAIRELQEETGLEVESCVEVYTYTNDDCIIKYFECVVANQYWNPFNDIPQVLLDNNEHSNFVFLGKDDWQDENLILNLKSVLNHLYVNEIEKTAIETIKKGVESGLVANSILDLLIKGDLKYGTGKKQQEVQVHSKSGKTFTRRQIVGKKEEDKSTNNKEYTDDELSTHARNASQQDLERHIKENGNEKMRVAAQNELHRREQDEKSVEEVSEIDELREQKDLLLNDVEKLTSLKNKLYGDKDISEPKSTEEKELDKNIAAIFSQINQLVKKINSFNKLNKAEEDDLVKSEMKYTKDQLLELIEEHENLVQLLTKYEDKEDIKRELDKQKKELEGYKKQIEEFETDKQ